MRPILLNRNHSFFLSASLSLPLFAFYFLVVYPGPCRVAGNLGILRATAQNQVSLVLVKMDLTGAVEFNGQALTKNQLAVAVKQEFDRLPPELRTLTIRAPKGIPYGKVAECLDGLQKTGVKRTKLVYYDFPN